SACYLAEMFKYVILFSLFTLASQPLISQWLNSAGHALLDGLMLTGWQKIGRKSWRKNATK
ncbi:MAG: hypothetical protein VXX49_00775, partial [Pseudomonadota bacterium]|nr:hypothetical protein [Pseudomonadota bacterium]